MKVCIACGMPMNEVSDFAMNDMQKNYCRYCARKDGTMQSYNEKLESLTSFIQRTQGLDEQKAQETAKNIMKKLPAWKEHH